MSASVAERGTKTKPAKGDSNRNEGKEKVSETMLKEDAGTQNEGRRDSTTNVEYVGKTRSEDKRDTKIKREVGKTRSEDNRDPKTKIGERRTQGTALCVGLISPGSVWNSGVYEGGADNRILVEAMKVLKRDYEVKSNGCRGGNQT